MFIDKSTDWWRDQILLATAEFLKCPNDFHSAKIKSLLKNYQIQHEVKNPAKNPVVIDEHEQVMDFR